MRRPRTVFLALFFANSDSNVANSHPRPSLLSKNCSPNNSENRHVISIFEVVYRFLTKTHSPAETACVLYQTQNRRYVRDFKV